MHSHSSDGLLDASNRNVPDNNNIQGAQVWSSNGVEPHTAETVPLYTQILGDDGFGLDEENQASVRRHKHAK